MVMKRFNQPISDEVIWEKMVKHRSTRSSKDRKLIKRKLPNGHGAEDPPTFYALHGSPIRGYAIRIDNRIHMYESDGTRWATYGLCSDKKSAIKDEIAEEK